MDIHTHDTHAHIRFSSEGLSYLWLGIGVVLTIFSNGNYAVPIAAWLFPVFILRFLRSQSILRGLFLAWIYITSAVTVALWPMLPVDNLPFEMLLGACFLWGLRYFLPFLLDRLVATRLQGFARTLIFPLAWVTVEYLFTQTTEGSWGALAYTQYGNLPLMQMVSVTGIWGIAFLLTWFAATVNWVWETGFEWRRIQRGLILFGGIWILVLVFGGVRLAHFYPDAKTVRVAAITKPEPFSLFFDVQGRRESVCRYSREEQSYFLEKSKKAAKNGAKVVAWQEHAVFIPEEDADSFVARCQKICLEAQIYLIMAYNTYPKGFPDQPWTNKLTGIDRFGHIAWEYCKSFPSIALEPGLMPGNRRLPVLQSPYGKIGAVICTDQEHPSLVRQAGLSGAFLLFVPSGGWKGVTPLHTQMASFRAIENGCALVKPNGNGLTAAFDQQGRVLSQLNYFQTEDENIMFADVPTQVANTLYTQIGDSFAWLCLICIAAVFAMMPFQRKRTSGDRKTRRVEQIAIEEPQINRLYENENLF